MTSALDIEGFRALNGLAGRSDAFDAVIIFGATGLVFVMAALVVAYLLVAWKTSHLEGRTENDAHVLLTVLVAFAAERIIGWLWFRPRPFAVLEGVYKLADRLAEEKSFPSGHATFAFAMAFGLWMHNRKWGKVMLVLAVVVALSRVAAGVHWPTDVMAGVVVGFVAALVTGPIKRALHPMLDWLPLFGKR